MQNRTADAQSPNEINERKGKFTQLSKSRATTPNGTIVNLTISSPTKTVSEADFILAVLYGGCILKAFDKLVLIELKHLRHCQHLRCLE
jgi:hypothetical protein